MQISANLQSSQSDFTSSRFSLVKTELKISILTRISVCFQIPRIGLIVSERIANLPHSLAAPLVNVLFDELAWSRGEMEEGGYASVGAEDAIVWSMDYYLSLTQRVLPGKQYKPGDDAGPGKTGVAGWGKGGMWGSSAVQHSGSWPTSAVGGVDYRPRPEDQAFGDVAELKIMYDCHNDDRTTIQVYHEIICQR